VITANGVRIPRKSLKIDREGSIDITTGERTSMILPNELEYGGILGQGNGGQVVRATHLPSGLPLAIKIINIFDKEKRH